MQQEQSKKNVIVRGWPIKSKVSFDEDGLRRVAGTQSRQISINGNTVSSLLLRLVLTYICALQTILLCLLTTVAGQLL